MTQDAAQALTFALRGVGAYARVVDPAQLEPSSPPPPPAEDPPADEGRGGMGFGGTVAAVFPQDSADHRCPDADLQPPNNDFGGRQSCISELTY